MSFVFFALVTLGILLGSHYLLYVTTVRAFDVTSRAARLTLLAAVSVLSVSFFLSAIVSRVFGNFISSAASWIASLWTGLWLHLLAVLAVFWLAYAMSGRMKNLRTMRTVFVSFLGIAVVVTAYGTASAFNVAVTRLDVRLADLPPHWKGKTVVQLSDVHLGTIRGPRFFRSVVEEVNRIDPKLVVITGDLFDGMGAELDRFTGPLRDLALSRDVLFVSGNHEGYLGLTEPLSVIRDAGIRILDDEVIEIDGLQLAGVSFPEFGTLNKRLSVTTMGEAIDPDRPCILLYHTPTDAAESNSRRSEQQTNTYLSPDVDFSFAREYRVDLQLSGHTHQGQIFPFTYVTKWIFGGYHYGLHTVDGFSIYITSGTGTWGPPLRTGSKSEMAAITLR